MTSTAAPGRRRLAREATALSVGAAISGIAAYAFAAIGARAVGTDAFAPVSVLWSYWAITVAAVTFPLQHWVIRQTRAGGGDGGLRHALPRVAAIVAALSIASGAIAWVLREDLFRRGDALFPLYTGLVPLGAGLMGLLRGRLAGAGRFQATALALAAENLVRVALAAVGAALGWEAGAYGAILVAAFAIGFAWPSAFRLGRAGSGAPAHVGLLVGIAAGSILAQLVLTGAPIALALLGAAPTAVTSMFAALALFRAPYIVGTGIATRLTGLFTGLVVEGNAARLWLVQGLTAVTVVSLSTGAGLLGWLLGLRVLRALFGAGIVLERSSIAIVAVGCLLAFGTLIQTLVLIGRARWDLIVLTWLLSLGAGAVMLAVRSGDPEQRVAWAFLTAELIAYALMTVAEVRTLRRPITEPAGEVIVPGV